jgi:hypothetical protein
VSLALILLLVSIAAALAAIAVGGRLVLASTPGAGTRASLVFPSARSRPGATALSGGA